MENTLLSPCCAFQYLNLSIEKRKKIVNEKVYEGDFYVYTCDGCGLKYTSTKSDTLSIKNLKHKKL